MLGRPSPECLEAGDAPTPVGGVAATAQLTYQVVTGTSSQEQGFRQLSTVELSNSIRRWGKGSVSTGEELLAGGLRGHAWGKQGEEREKGPTAMTRDDVRRLAMAENMAAGGTTPPPRPVRFGLTPTSCSPYWSA